MISFNFNVTNPFNHRWDCIANPSYQFSKNKIIELQVDRTNDIIGFGFRLTFRQAHAGIFFSLALLGYDVTIHFYDSRHWDNENNCWQEL